MLTHAFLFLMAFLGGGLNAIAGGGSFLTLPALVYVGVPPVSANATSTLAMWPAAIASGLGYRHDILAARRWIPMLGTISLVGGLLGGLLLVKTSDTRFLTLLPWLMLVAVATFTFGSQVTLAIRRRFGRGDSGTAFGSSPDERLSLPPWILVLQLVIATYGGYFGGGMGIMMLAAFAIAGMTDLHAMNGLKALLAVAINGVALAAFIIDGAIAWAPGMVMVAGGIAGGYLGAGLARRLGVQSVRRLVVGVGWSMTAYFFAESLRR